MEPQPTMRILKCYDDCLDVSDDKWLYTSELFYGRFEYISCIEYDVDNIRSGIGSI